MQNKFRFSDSDPFAYILGFKNDLFLPHIILSALPIISS